ncbi:MAG: NifB/NifX family molybdenum-iron cluster-binding protein [Candidatus Saccharicenans sp.]|nr:NifB/NifX family molybdenum-iron cluster-binding protein [Candidatus Saccharicenans sp.]
MLKRIVLPVAENKGLASRIADHFGRAPYFLIVEVDEQGQIASERPVSNSGEHSGGRGHAHDSILEFEPDYLIVPGMGPRGLKAMKSAGVEVLRTGADQVQEALEAFREGRLEILNQGCGHHRGGHD